MEKSPAGAGRGSACAIPRPLLVVCVAVVAVVALPVGVTVLQAIGGGLSSPVDALRSGTTRTLLLHTVIVAVLAAPACGVLGVSTAWLIERTRLPGRRMWALLVVVPLTIPLFVTSYAWADLGASLQGVWGAAGIVIFSYYPIIFLLVSASLRGIDPALEESARSLGLSPTRTFFRVVLPQLRPALLGGLLLVVLDTLVEFDAFVALRYRTFSIDVYSQYRLSFSTSGAAGLALISTLLCVVVLIVEARLRGGQNYTRVSHGARRAAGRYRLGRTKPAVLAGFAGLVAVSVGIPFGTLASWFTRTSQTGSGAAAGLNQLAPATVTSLGIGVGGAGVALALALPIALLTVRYRGRRAALLERATYLSFALPDLVAAIALSYAAVHYVRFLYQSFVLVVLADALLFVPFAVVALRATLGQIEPALEDVARSLGAGALRTLARVTLPVARPGFAAGGVLVFAFVLGDLATAQVLLPSDLSTLGTAFQADSSTVDLGAAAPFAAVLIGLSVLAAWVLMNGFGQIHATEEA